MKSRNVADTQWIEETFAIYDAWATPRDDCPDQTRLWATAAAKLPREEIRTVLDHAMACRYCTESWRLALRLGAKPKVPFWVQVWVILCADLRLLLELPGRLVRLGRFLKEQGVRRGSLPVLAPAGFAAAMIVLGVIAFQDSKAFSHTDHPLQTTRGGINKHLSGFEIKTSIREGRRLSRNEFLLIWSGPAGARYDLRITTMDDVLVDSAHGLAEPRYQVPAHKLGDLEPNIVLHWHVSSYVAGRPGDSAVFSVRVD